MLPDVFLYIEYSHDSEMARMYELWWLVSDVVVICSLIDCT